MDRNGRKHGLILRVIGDRIVFAPPLIIEQAEVDEAIDRFARTLDDTWAEVQAEFPDETGA
jgi:putrescine aminotransferase